MNKELHERCDKMDKENKMPWVQLNNEIYDFRRLAYQKVEKAELLTEDESVVLFELIKLLPESGFMNLLDITEKIGNLISMTELDVYKVISKLVDKKLVSLGISYPF
jgi:hypothetical protein